MASNAKKFLPLLDRVLVERARTGASKSAGGILLPESASKMNEGAVVAVGPGRRSLTGELIPVGVKAGDKVLLPEFGGVPVKLGEGGVDGPEYVVYRDEELLGVLTG